MLFSLRLTGLALYLRLPWCSDDGATRDETPSKQLGGALKKNGPSLAGIVCAWPEATTGGVLDLRWYGVPGRGGAGRGCQVAEVWLIKKSG